ncbi:MAG TPA: hypothetical protein EYP89_02110 [Candidatus Omnitrophica bacterium]|nr:hypothetical protein [Candidatus Omnitrophota bacterium]
MISTGNDLACINKIFSSYLGAKSVIILRPNLSLSKFDLSIIPEHDRITIDRDKIIKIKGALFYPHRLEEKIKQCRNFFRLSEDKKISLFLGGPLRDKKEFMNNLKIFLKQLKEFSQDKGYKLLITTSRRTPLDIEEYLEKELRDFTNLEVAVYPKKKNYDFVFEGFVMVSEVCLVSSESISMISEIASLKKTPVVVSLEKEEDKHYVFLESMKDDIYVLKPPYLLKEIELKESSIFEENKRRIEEAIKKLF